MSPAIQNNTSSGSDQRQWKRLAVSLGLITCTGILFAFNPANISALPLCPFHALTGLYCPGCGMLRAAHQLLRGHVIVALGLNSLIILSLPIAAYGFLHQFSVRLHGRQLPNVQIPIHAVWTSAVVVVAFWILRNLPLYPFSILAP